MTEFDDVMRSSLRRLSNEVEGVFAEGDPSMSEVKAWMRKAYEHGWRDGLGGVAT
jgi:hypothetical protein